MALFRDQAGSDRKCYACGYQIVGMEFPRCPQCGRQLRLEFRSRANPPADVVRAAVVHPPRDGDGSTIARIESNLAEAEAEMQLDMEAILG